MSAFDAGLDDPGARELIFRPSEAARSREIDGEAVLLHLEKGLYFRLNSSATLIWQGLSDGLSLGTLCDQLRRSQAIDGDQLWRELLELVRDLEQEGLIERRPKASG